MGFFFFGLFESLSGMYVLSAGRCYSWLSTSGSYLPIHLTAPSSMDREWVGSLSLTNLMLPFESLLIPDYAYRG